MNNNKMLGSELYVSKLMLIIFITIKMLFKMILVLQKRTRHTVDTLDTLNVQLYVL